MIVIDNNNMGMGSVVTLDTRDYDNEQYVFIRIKTDMLYEEDNSCLGMYLNKEQCLLLSKNLINFANNCK